MQYTVRSGECLDQLAVERGLNPNTIWDHPRNASLRRTRGPRPAVMAGDQIYLPVTKSGVHPARAGHRHRYRRKGIRQPFVTKLVENGQPRSHTAYQLDLGSFQVTGCTDEQGVIRQWVPVWATHATLTVDGQTFHVTLVHKQRSPRDPDGTRYRLQNLGYLQPTVVDDPNDLLKALARFQSDHDLKPTGHVDELTRYKLRLIHGS